MGSRWVPFKEVHTFFQLLKHASMKQWILLGFFETNGRHRGKSMKEMNLACDLNWEDPTGNIHHQQLN